MRIVILLVTLTCLLSACSNVSSHQFDSLGRATSTAAKGSTILLIDNRCPQEPRLRLASQKACELVRESLNALPCQPVVDSEPFLQALGPVSWTGAGDEELCRTAQKLDIQTIVLLRLRRFENQLSIHLPLPLWESYAHFSYDLRVIDARTGSIYVLADRERRVGGLLAAKGKEALEREFSAELREVFTPLQHKEAN